MTTIFNSFLIINIMFGKGYLSFLYYSFHSEPVFIIRITGMVIYTYKKNFLKFLFWAQGFNWAAAFIMPLVCNSSW